MQPQSKSMYRADVATIAVSDERTVGMDSTITRLRKISFILRQWIRRWRERRQLRAMSQREIADFCPKLTDALHEADKPFWRP
jgi:uncharacterized protein YjiS (DUF1127 family)